MTLLKVIIPIFNSKKYISRCLESVLKQTEHRYEVVLIDDGSTDGSSEICEYYAANDSRFHVVYQENKGLSAARNVGIDYPIESKYITFIDSDDWIPPHSFCTLVDSLERTGCELAIGKHIKTAHYFINAPNEKSDISIMTPEESYCSKSISITPAWGKIYAAQLFETIRFPEGRIYEEYATSWKLIFSVNRIAVVSDVVYYYFINEEGIVHSKWNPNKMDIFGALYEKREFFHNNGHYEAEKRAQHKIVKMAEKFIKQIQEEGKYVAYLDDLFTIIKNINTRENIDDISNDGNNN